MGASGKSARWQGAALVAEAIGKQKHRQTQKETDGEGERGIGRDRADNDNASSG